MQYTSLNAQTSLLQRAQITIFLGTNQPLFQSFIYFSNTYGHTLNSNSLIPISPQTLYITKQLPTLEPQTEYYLIVEKNPNIENANIITDYIANHTQFVTAWNETYNQLQHTKLQIPVECMPYIQTLHILEYTRTLLPFFTVVEIVDFLKIYDIKLAKQKWNAQHAAWELARILQLKTEKLH